MNLLLIGIFPSGKPHIVIFKYKITKKYWGGQGFVLKSIIVEPLLNRYVDSIK